MPKNKHKEASDFFALVYEVTKSIPYGRVTSYGAIARYLGTGRSARAVGWALNACCSQSELIPAHRVVNRKGFLTGKRHFGGSTMAQLLISEGAIIEDDCILNFKELFWEPSIELSVFSDKKFYL
jgi:methylated-DNA-protein-cysteine methyltransferase-like protein